MMTSASSTSCSTRTSWSPLFVGDLGLRHHRDAGPAAARARRAGRPPEDRWRERREELRATPSRGAQRQARRAARRAHHLHESDAGPLQAGQYAGSRENSQEKLAQAGYRGQAPLIAFMFFRFVMPFIVFVVTLFYLFVVTAFRAGRRCMKFGVAFAGALFGFYLPDLFVSNIITAPPAIHHARLSRRAGPDADLRRIGHVDRKPPSRGWPPRSAPSPPSWPKNWR